ncbi:hypothetical protein C0995_005208 [Termitomyces sp. Mi166|nr:hypothetical protein C0995_005208 [Termitomyces sp. Mi166\
MVSRFVYSSLPSLRSTRNFTTKAPPSRPLIGRYTDKVPVDLARVQSSRNVKLRDYETQRELKRFSYDLKLQNGKVLPADGPNFIGPNGCSLRPPLSPTFQEVVRNFRGANIIVSVIPEGALATNCISLFSELTPFLGQGTPLPSTLQILHEHSDHYSMQCTKPMTLNELNDELTKFMTANSRTMDKEQFDEEYPFSLDF